VKAVVVLRPGETATPEDLREYAKSRQASFKAPEYVTFVEELPRNALGKVLKTELRKLYGAPSS
jgi:acyl-CoA synthetase (AMP-forming)/AMP-acid ligase II